jgi:hypothetical protein
MQVRVLLMDFAPTVAMAREAMADKRKTAKRKKEIHRHLECS